jgi:hypothetical protein
LPDDAISSNGNWHKACYAKYRRNQRTKNGKGERVKRDAHTYVLLALRYGHLVKPDRCQECGNPETSDNLLQAHHHEGYTDPLRGIVWVCKGKCHGIWNRRKRVKDKAPSPELQAVYDEMTNMFFDELLEKLDP